MRKELYKTNVCVIVHDSRTACIELDWQGYATSIQFRTVAEQLLTGMQATGAGKVLDDHSHMKMLGEEDQNWVMDSWLERALLAGFKAWAVVRSSDYFNRLSTQSLFDRIERKRLATASFDDREAASAWLFAIS
jgi:hypothetical protein